jgi:hypothetical protein
MLDKFQIAHIGTLMAALQVQNWEATIIILKWLLDKFQISATMLDNLNLKIVSGNTA